MLGYRNYEAQVGTYHLVTSFLVALAQFFCERLLFLGREELVLVYLSEIGFKPCFPCDLTTSEKDPVAAPGQLL